MEPGCSCRRVCKFVMFLMGFPLIFAGVTLLYYTVSTLKSSGNFCILWLDIAGLLNLFAIGFYVAGICGSIPFPDIFRPEGFPEPLFNWTSSTGCSECPRNCACVFWICSCRTLTSSQPPLLEDPYSPEHPRYESPHPVVSSSCASSRPDSNVKRSATENIPQIQVFKFDKHGSLASSNSLEPAEYSEKYLAQAPCPVTALYPVNQKMPSLEFLKKY